jgi:hypothetical protein
VKIAVGGAHSSGKTTFLGRLRTALEAGGYHVASVGDQAAAARDHGFPIMRRQTATTTLWIMTTGIAAELVAGRRAEVVLVDRPITDALAYHAAALAWRQETEDPATAAFLTDLARHHVPSYDLIYRTVIDPGYGIHDDGHRDLDPVYRQLADEAISRVHSELAVPAIPLSSTKHPDAVRQAFLLARRLLPARKPTRPVNI